MYNHEEEAGKRLWNYIEAHTRRTEASGAGPDEPLAGPDSEDEELMSLANVVRGFLCRDAETVSGQAAARARLVEEIRADQLIRSQPQTARFDRPARPAFAWSRTLVLLVLLLALLAAVAAGVEAWSTYHQAHCALDLRQTPLVRADLKKSVLALPLPPCHMEATARQGLKKEGTQTNGFSLGVPSTIDLTWYR